MSVLKKIISGCCAIAVACSLAACGEDTAWANKINGEEIRAGIYITYLIDGYSAAAGKFDTAGIKSDLWNQSLEGKEFSEYVKDSATEYCKKYVAVQNKFDELGLEFTESNLKAAQLAVENFWTADNEKAYKKLGVSKQSLIDISVNNAKSEMIFKAYYGKDGISEPTEDEVLAEIKANFAPVNILVVSLLDENNAVIDDAAKAEKLKEAEGLADRIKKGETFVSVYDEYNASESTTDDSSTADAEEPELDKYETVLYENMYYAFYPNEVVDASLAMEVDEVRIVTSEKYYFVVQKNDILASKTYIDTYFDTSLRSLKQDEFDAIFKEIYDGYSIELNQKAYDRYKPKKVLSK